MNKRKRRKREEKKEKKKKEEGRKEEEKKKSRYGIGVWIICIEFVYGKYVFGTLV